MMMMLSSQGFLTLFMGLELHSFPLYILSSLKRDDARASEAGMKYFLLGALATGILLYGISLIYGATGSFAFDQIHQVLSTTPPSLGVMMGLFFVLGGLVFKISAVPFHMWTPDVYEGTPTSVTTFLATVPKIATYGILIRILMDPFGSLASHWSMVLMALSFASMLVGSFAILNQRNIRRFIAYSTIANGGYSLMGLLMGNNSGVQATLLYIILYSITIFGFFCCLITLRNRGKTVETISDLSGLSTLYPGLTFVMVCFLFSLAGIPPLAGFFGKLYVFNAAIQGNFITLAIVGILTSVVTAGYYLWIIKVMTMDGVNLSNWIPDKSLTGTGKEDRAALSMALVVLALIVIFFITPTPFLDFLLKAADSLLPGGRWS
jgi:NADH-quinone oxidoreductase subunit N